MYSMYKLHLCIVAIIATLICICSPVVVQAQEEEKVPVNLTLGAIRTEAERSAVGFLAEYTKNIGDIFTTGLSKGKKSGSLFDFSPEIRIQTGDEDSFNGIIAKLSGNYILFRTTTVGNVVTPDSSKLFHVFPASLGFEADRNFRKVNALVEVGYVPFKKLSPTMLLGVNPLFGVFLQGGYTSIQDDDEDVQATTGGAEDESQETSSGVLFRAKADLGFDYPIPPKYLQGLDIRLIGKATGWYDFAHTDTYHQLQGIFRIGLSKDRFFDLKYENGSGAPNFNKGDQFSSGLTIQF